VFFFPKRNAGRRGTPFEFASPISRTLPELELEEVPEHATEPAFFSPFAEKADPVRPTRRRSRRRTLENAHSPDAAVTEEIPVHAAETARPYAGLSRREIAEVSLFGHGQYEGGRIDEARQVFEQLVASGAQDAFPHTMLGTIYLAQKAPDHALALFESALAIDPHDLAARVYRGEIRLHRGDFNEALADLTWARDQGAKGDPFTDRARRLLEATQGRRRRS
jgi:tetratricopeptide (TPR) repeat protein